MFFKLRRFLFSAAAPLCPACATVFAMAGLITLIGESAQADISAYAKDVSADATNSFLTTNASTSPEPVNIGTLNGNNTYEFIVNAKTDLTSSDALMGVGDGGEAIKFDQFPDSGDYGATIYTVADYRFNVQETLGTPVVLDFVAHPATGTTELFVDGVDTGSSVPFAVALSGEVGLAHLFTATTSLPTNSMGLSSPRRLTIRAYRPPRSQPTPTRTSPPCPNLPPWRCWPPAPSACSATLGGDKGQRDELRTQRLSTDPTPYPSWPSLRLRPRRTRHEGQLDLAAGGVADTLLSVHGQWAWSLVGVDAGPAWPSRKAVRDKKKARPRAALWRQATRHGSRSQASSSILVMGGD